MGCPVTRSRASARTGKGICGLPPRPGSAVFSGTDFKTFTSRDGLAHDEVESVFLDSQGFLWFGTLNGLSRFDGQTFDNFTIADGLLNNRVAAVFEDRAGDLWIGSFTGLNQYSYSITNFTSRDGLVHEDLRAIAEDEKGGLWFGTLDGLSYFNQGRFSNFRVGDGLPDNRIFALVVDRGRSAVDRHRTGVELLGRGRL